MISIKKTCDIEIKRQMRKFYANINLFIIKFFTRITVTIFEHLWHFWHLCHFYDIFPGTPNEQTWPGVSSLADYKSTFPSWQPQDLKDVVPAMDEVARDLLKVVRLDHGSREIECMMCVSWAGA